MALFNPKLNCGVSERISISLFLFLYITSLLPLTFPISPTVIPILTLLCPSLCSPKYQDEISKKSTKNPTRNPPKSQQVSPQNLPQEICFFEISCHLALWKWKTLPEIPPITSDLPYNPPKTQSHLKAASLEFTEMQNFPWEPIFNWTSYPLTPVQTDCHLQRIPL